MELRWEAGQNSALDSAKIVEGRDVGNVVAKRRSKIRFVDVPYHVTFAFVFHPFYPSQPILML